MTHLGVLSDAEKLSVIGASRLLVHPSPYESLSMALLEAWKMGRPALVNGRCSVLRGQVQRAGGGLYYGAYEEFAEALTWLLSRPAEADALGRAGRAYFERHYSWPVIMEKYERLLACASAS
jgi:glycosyltransferase involved in cell wall biosynthesis